ncbi:MAG: tyrosine-type recombinase/integrase [Proteobacteria bacterium]|jgi:hypothetical protein|nr:tyrosine-type recombinase/integrase [Pseudomonadota bacterium]
MLSYWEININRRRLDGVAKRVRRRAEIQTRKGAEREEREIRQAIADGTFDAVREEVPTFEEWFNDRFWTEWVVAQRNKPAEQESKRSVFKCHLKQHFGDLRLDEIAGGSHVAQFKAKLMASVDAGKLSLKSVNNILAVLSIRDGQTTHAIYRICRRATLPERGWHALRHTFGTHAALFGVNPWSLQNWMGHKRIDETMRYVHFANDHRRPWPEAVAEAYRSEADPDRRIVKMLSARGTTAEHGRDNEEGIEAAMA